MKGVLGALPPTRFSFSVLSLLTDPGPQSWVPRPSPVSSAVGRSGTSATWAEAPPWGPGDAQREGSLAERTPSTPTWPTSGVWHSLWTWVQIPVTLGRGSSLLPSQKPLGQAATRSVGSPGVPPALLGTTLTGGGSRPGSPPLPALQSLPPRALPAFLLGLPSSAGRHTCSVTNHNTKPPRTARCTHSEVCARISGQVTALQGSAPILGALPLVPFPDVGASGLPAFCVSHGPREGQGSPRAASWSKHNRLCFLGSHLEWSCLDLGSSWLETTSSCLPSTFSRNRRGSFSPPPQGRFLQEALSDCCPDLPSHWILSFIGIMHSLHQKKFFFS